MDHHPRNASDRTFNVTILPNAEAASAAVADKILSRVRAKPAAVLGLATGQTPRRVYAKLIDAVANGEISFAHATTFNLDEYCGLTCSHADSFAAYMHRELFDKAGFDQHKINLIDGAAADEKAEADRYARLLVQHTVDLQLLGIGTNGHIGFNEPGSSSMSRVRVVELSEETQAANRPTLIELDQVPRHAITMGIADILDAREIVILATGQAKAESVYRSLREAPDDTCPASHLAGHGNVHWILDEAAANLL
ncbi:glucosamine-6-phosphate deaminase [Rhizobiales bacterium RZME27]|uniref:Glucosamine-6-phosphate deaminase n=1 Tax=Endobacterium cereale TaxID=2663029 RepID=A0A6A8AE96_9HYPH|nr:glucosamine-6-phosphate deaminase [Endobacterium cereale]MEB2847225.1 glucosamine-6-phosphate deaminase [Endobacterium cereale]MQY49074.1 glucosamine-6-phosphate deaminase [Endobacterium cereale]